MAIKYYDPSRINSGTRDGTSYANRGNNWTSQISSLAPGDELRIRSSPNPILMDQTATWTQGSLVVTLSATACINLYDDGAWTDDSGGLVTCTTNTTNKKEGANCASMTFAAGFTTGRAAYYNFGSPLGGDGFTQMSGWVRSSTADTANRTQIYATTGANDTGTAKYTFYPTMAANTWTHAYNDRGLVNGGSFQTIQSVGLQIGADPGTSTVLIDNIILSQAASSTFSLVHCDLIAPSASGPWYPIKSINGTTITLDNHCNSLQGQGRGYWGVTGTFPLYKRKVMPNSNGASGIDSDNIYSVPNNGTNGGLTTATAATTAIIQSGTITNGTSNNRIKVSGGWSAASSMSVQDGESWFYSGNALGNLLATPSTQDFIDIENIYFVRGNLLLPLAAGSTDNILRNCGTVACTASPALGPATGVDRVSYIDCYTGNNQTIGFGTATNATNAGLIVRGLKSYNNGGLGFSSPIGTAFAQGYTEVSDVEVANNGGAQGFLLQNPCKYINNIRSYDNAVTANNAAIDLTRQNHIAFNLTASGVVTANAAGILVSGDNPRLYSAYTVGCNRGILAGAGTLGIDSKINLYNYSSSGNTVDFGFPASNANQGWINSMGAGGVSTANTSTSTYGTVTTNTSVIHSGTYSWQLAPGSTTQATQYAPLDHTIGRIPCNANRTITIKYWAQRSSTNLTAQLRIIGGLIAGVGSIGSDVITSISGGAGAWAQYSISCTPTIDCVLEVLAEAYITSGSGHSVYFDGLVEVT